MGEYLQLPSTQISGYHYHSPIARLSLFSCPTRCILFFPFAAHFVSIVLQSSTHPAVVPPLQNPLSSHSPSFTTPRLPHRAPRMGNFKRRQTGAALPPARPHAHATPPITGPHRSKRCTSDGILPREHCGGSGSYRGTRRCC